MTRDQDPILCYDGMYALALAYQGTANNKPIRHLLHFWVSDVSDDVRRTAVLAIGFVLYSELEQVGSKCVPKFSLCFLVFSIEIVIWIFCQFFLYMMNCMIPWCCSIVDSSNCLLVIWVLQPTCSIWRCYCSRNILCWHWLERGNIFAGASDIRCCWFCSSRCPYHIPMVMVQISASSDSRVGTFRYCTYFVRHFMFFLAVACYFIIFRLLLVMLISDSGYTIIIYNFLFVL